MAISPTMRGMAIGAAAIVAAYVLGSPGTGEAAPASATAPTPVFEDLGLFVPDDTTGDGLNRFLLAVPSVGEGDGDRGVDMASMELDLGRLSDVDGTAHLVGDEDGRIWGVLEDGERVLVRGDAPRPDSAAELIEWLEAEPEIHDVRLISEDTVAVTTSLTASEVSGLAGVAVTPDQALTAFESDPYFEHQWGLENDGRSVGSVVDADIDVIDAWARSSGGTGVVVAVIDTGVDFTHPDLAAGRWENRGEICGNAIDDDANGYIDDCHSGWDFVENDAQSWDGSNHYHGTHVAGIIGARRDQTGVAGVAPRSTIMDLRVLDSRGSGYSSSFAEAIRYAVANGADIINMSLGTQPDTPRSAFSVVESAVAAARDAGVLVVAAAGNSNVDIDAQPVWPAAYGGLYENVLTVAATDGADLRSSFSNYGPTSVAIGAPGSQILSTLPRSSWGNASGTSMAAPMAAGAAALVLGDNPGSTPRQVVERLVIAGDPTADLVGKLLNPRRLNVGSLYVEGALTPSTVSAVGLHDLYEEEVIDAEVTMAINDVAMFAGRDFGWEARLLTAVDDTVYGLVDHEVTVDGSVKVSDEAAAVALVAGLNTNHDPHLAYRPITVSLSTSLPAGSYALAVEPLGPEGDPVAPASVLYFTVDAGARPSPPTTLAPSPSTPSSPSPSSPSPSSPSPSSPSPSSPAPSPSPSSPSPSSPAPSSPGPTQPGSSGPGSSGPTTSAGGSPAPAPSSPGSGSPTSQAPGAPSPSSPSPTSAPSDPQPTVPPGQTPPGSPTTRPAGPGPSTPAAPSTSSPGSPPRPAPGWSITTVSPDRVEIGVRGMVSLHGTFPMTPQVWLGPSKATVVSATDSKIVIDLPRVVRPGIYDVTLRVGSSTMLRLGGGFTFFDPDGPPPTAPTSAPVTTVPPVVTTSPIASPVPDPSRWYTGESPLSFGTPVMLSNGLMGAPLQAMPEDLLGPSDWRAHACGQGCVGHTL